MTLTVDLNADLGESFGPWPMGRDPEVLEVITSANIACGWHAGDPDVMAQTYQTAMANDVGLGAHPGFPDLQGFGRRRMQIPHASLANMVQYQTAAAQGMARAAGGHIRHVKLHGAMGNMTSEDVEMAKVCYDAALALDPDLIMVVLSGTAQQRAVEGLGCRWVGEIFADRAYNEDATLVDRREAGAMIHDPDEAADRVVRMVQARAMIAKTGVEIPGRVDTVCLHGDSATALDIARTTRTALEAAGITVQRFMA